MSKAKITTANPPFQTNTEELHLIIVGLGMLNRCLMEGEQISMKENMPSTAKCYSRKRDTIRKLAIRLDMLLEDALNETLALAE